MKILCYRHPKPLGGDQLCYGQTDLDIDDVERMMMTKILKPLVSKREVHFYTSPLKRCVKIANSLGRPYVIEPALQEISFGLYDGMPWDKVPRQDLDLWAQDVEGYHFPGGESYKDLRERVRTFLSLLGEKSLKKGESILLLTHAGVMRALMELIEDKGILETLKIPLAYGSCLELNWSHDFV